MTSLRQFKLIVTGAITALPAGAHAAANGAIQSQTTFTDLGQIPKAIFSLLIAFLPAIATIYLAIAGYRYMTSQGNPDLMEKAKKNLTYAVAGAVIAYLSFFIIQFVGQQLGFGFSL